MQTLRYAILFCLGILTGGALAYSVLRTECPACGPCVTEALPPDTVTQSVPLPVPYPVPGNDRIVYRDTGSHSLTTVHVTSTDTLYADCDTARRYTAEHTDSNGTVRYVADVCGRILSQRFELSLVHRPYAVIRPDGRGAGPATRIYAVGSSTPTIGAVVARPRWLAGYGYTPGAEGVQQHVITVGLCLWPLTKKHK
jgi:hypothetical protein